MVVSFPELRWCQIRPENEDHPICTHIAPSTSYLLFAICSALCCLLLYLFVLIYLTLHLFYSAPMSLHRSFALPTFFAYASCCLVYLLLYTPSDARINAVCDSPYVSKTIKSIMVGLQGSPLRGRV
ncbi:hypothetical protein NEOLEDRAFT_358184 [Neolentinus lepideus HHB14362 ss-1]|uniref:Uncharacterized protein n=1 Tax=Neolentinus lepideus HHB14362 ss-1 TaxID=1314782 RepID=A0A165SLK8_9AGAM|nr:hypothetical protein NEOLEDRAFT_358184 [Neolentinus lepideus HHB14362 ss-1]